MFSVVKFRDIDYNYEASVRNRLMMNVLMLPVPNKMLFPTINLQEEEYRNTWSCVKLSSSCQFEELSSEVNDLKADRSAESLERFEVCLGEPGGDVVPSSNPASQRCVESPEAQWLLNGEERTAEQGGVVEMFSMVHPSSDSFQDLYLLEEVITSDTWLKSNLPSLSSLMKKLKTLLVSDPLDLHQCGSSLIEHISFRHCASYEASSFDIGFIITHSVHEEFRKETWFDPESFMLPVIIQSSLLDNSDYISSVNKLKQVLNLVPEPSEEHHSVLAVLQQGSLCLPECQTFTAPVLHADITSSEKLNSPVPFRSYVELETDLLLSPSDRKVLPELFPPTSQLSPEFQSPVCSQSFLSHSEHEALMKVVWRDEQHHQCVSGLLLNEPQIVNPPVRMQRSLSELISLLGAERTSDDAQTPSPLTLSTDTSTYHPHIHTLTVDTHSGQETPGTEDRVMEQFHLLSVNQIDELLKKPADKGVGLSVSGVGTAAPSSVQQEKLVKVMLEDDSSTQSTTENGNSILTKSSPASQHRSVKGTAANLHSPNSIYQKILFNLNLMNSGTNSRTFTGRGDGTDPQIIPKTASKTHHPAEPPIASSLSVNTSTKKENRFLSSSFLSQLSKDAAEPQFIRSHGTIIKSSNLSAVSNKKPQPAVSPGPSAEASSNVSEHSEQFLFSENPSEMKSAHEPQTKQLKPEPSSRNSSGSPPPPAHSKCSLSEQAHREDMIFTSRPSDQPGTCSSSTGRELRGVPETPRRATEPAFKIRAAHGNASAPEEQLMDPLTSFMMLRGVSLSPVVQEQTPQCMMGSYSKEDKKLVKTPQLTTPRSVSVSDIGVQPQGSQLQKINQTKVPVPERTTCKTIHVPPTGTERGAYQELHAMALPALQRVQKSASNVLRGKDFSSLVPELTRFALKQEERLRSSGQDRNSVYNDVALLHILVTVKELLLRFDLNTAADYLVKVQSTSGMEELLRKFQVLQYLSSKWAEPGVRLQQLQEQISSWLQRNSSDEVLVVVAEERMKALVMTSGQKNGVSVSTDISEQTCGADSRCTVVCVQQVHSQIPWDTFSVVFEFQCLDHSSIRNICSRKNINYITFCTAVPQTDCSPDSSPLYQVPFVLFITEGLVKRTTLLQLLESRYNMTLLERNHPASLQVLGPTHLYDIITVDENTVILLQELRELEHERGSERVVLRLSALSLQFSCCWVLLHCTDEYSSLVCAAVFNNLLLMYAAFVLFGSKLNGLQVKVQLLCDEAGLAQSVHQISLHTLLRSRRSVWDWLHRDHFSVLPTDWMEQLLLSFPCVNSVVAQLLRSRAPSVHWLLGASHSQLEEVFPEIPHTVCKRFSETAAVYTLSTAAPSVGQKDTVHAWHPEQDPQLHAEPEPPSSQHPHLTCNQNQNLQSMWSSWFGAESEGMMDVQTHSWFEELEQDLMGITGFGSEVEPEDQPEELNPDLRFSHTHASFTPFSVLEMERTAGPSTAGLGLHCPRTDMYTEPQRRRPAGGAMHTNVPQCKKMKLLFERVPGRADGQTRLRFL